MRALGLDINEQPRTGAFGRIHGIQFDPETRTLIGAADPDWEGTARGPDEPTMICTVSTYIPSMCPFNNLDTPIGVTA